MPKKVIFILLVIFSLGILVYFSFRGWRNYFEIKRRQQEFEKRKVAWSILEEKIKQEVASFPAETGIFIRNLSRGWQIAINQDKSFPSASLVKIPIMASFFYAADEGKVMLNETLELKAKHKASGSGSLKDSTLGTAFGIEKLIELMISESDNTATNMLIERLGFDYLNSCFKKLGLKDTNISRRMMDFKSRKEGIENYTTAKDQAFLLERIYNKTLINKDLSLRSLEYLKTQKIRDRIPAKLPPETPVAHKTGLEKGICHDAGIVYTNKGDFLICVLTKHEDKNSKKAKEFIAQISYLVYNYFQDF